MPLCNFKEYIYRSEDEAAEPVPQIPESQVETIGDAYVVASGLPIRIGILHADEVTTMILELLSHSDALEIRNLPDVPIHGHPLGRSRFALSFQSNPAVAAEVISAQFIQDNLRGRADQGRMIQPLA
ncbi:unnamed protein product [Schistocephalus solidus]|uniref:Guanylate cyclase domain-containing protein n=1 Tax=Schistocephalus solidus TaxID=70667 RepID=A0A183THR3_SCHSO|nr:unnamed protein product [Schistocephalus solidus]